MRANFDGSKSTAQERMSPPPPAAACDRESGGASDRKQPGKIVSGRRYHPEGALHPVMLGDGDVLARLEGVRLEAVADLVGCRIGVGDHIVVEAPAAVAAMLQATPLVLRLRGEAAHRAECLVE